MLVIGREAVVLEHLQQRIVAADHPHVEILVPGHRIVRDQALPGLPRRADEILRIRIEDLAVDFDATFGGCAGGQGRAEENTSELQSLMRISYAVFCLKKKNTSA